MDLSQVLAYASKMFPSANLNEAVQKAQQMIKGAPDTLDGVSSIARKVGIDRNAINNVYQKYGGTAQARALCSMLGTTPEALKKDAESIVGGAQTSPANAQNASKRFPRLK